MSRIRILSEQLANQIAAGEVVERPASVIKELVENSLDAGATRIDIHVEGSGSVLLRVADNGGGMDGDDVLLCLERHATSKIREESQLAAIATLGFRGEAIPSIASVSWMTILSRPHDQELGTRAEVRYGTLRGVHQDGCARGTVIEVRHLFGNMPARKKFLKSSRTELHHIEEVVRNQALAHPAVGFSLHIDGRTSIDFPPDADLEQRVRDVFRLQGGRLLPLGVDTADPAGELRLDGFLLPPETAQTANLRLRILVNGRPVQDAMIRHAVIEGMQGFLMKGYQPAGALLLTVAPDQVDVNVHPAKREIRFRRGEVVHRFIAQRVRAALEGHQQTLRQSLFTASPGPSGRTHGQDDVRSAAADALLKTAEPRAAQPTLPMTAPSAPRPSSPPPRSMPFTEPDRTMEVPAPSSAEGGGLYGGLTLIGQLFALYLLCEKDGQFIVIDQHAAHERLLYGQLLQGYLETRMPQQTLLFPVTVELSPAQADTLEKLPDQVAALGLAVEPFGDATAVIKAVPALVSQIDSSALLREILDALRGAPARETGRPVPRTIDDLLASMACKAAVKAGNRLQPVEMLKLLDQMEASPVFSHCPHGRPVLKTFSAREVERWFHRHGG